VKIARFAKNRFLTQVARLVDAVERRRQPADLAPTLMAPGTDETLRALGERVASLVQSVDRQGDALQHVESRLIDTQALVARVYEQAHDWPRQLQRIRTEPDYALAWEEREPLVSVRIATYGAADLLCDRALATVRRQSYENWECIVVGDAEPATTAARVEAIGDPRIRFVNLPFRGPYPDDPQRLWRVAGIPGMNRGASEARGAWVAPLDHDDEWEDDHIEVLLDHARSSRAELVYGKLRVRDSASGRLVDNVVGAWPPVVGQFGLQGAIYHAGLRGFEMDLNAGFAGEPGDWNLARRMWEAGVRFAFLDRIVTTYYWSPLDAPGRAWLEANLVEPHD
jgi:hypothetical protein